MLISSETIRTGQSQVDASAQSHHQRLSTRDPQHYGKVWFEEIGELCVACDYRDRQAQIADVFKLISGTGTGMRLLADLKALSTQGVRIAVGPRDDFTPGATHIPINAVSTTVDGEVLWDCNYLGFLRDLARPAPDTYKRLIGDLTEIRNLAAKKAWPAVPPLSGKDVESSFLAELVLRGTPALAQSEVTGPGATPRYELGTGHMPAWGNEALRFDSLKNLMPAWLTTQGRQIRDELVAVLKVIDATPIGKALLNDLWVYGRSRGVMVIHRGSTGKESLRTSATVPVWGFDKSGLAARAKSTALTDREARASGAFLCLLEAHRELADKLGTLARLGDLTHVQRQFEAQLLGERKRHLLADGARTRHGAVDAVAWFDGNSVPGISAHGSNGNNVPSPDSPSSADASRATSIAEWSLHTPVRMPLDNAGMIADAPDSGRDWPQPAEHTSRHWRWLQDSLRIFTGSRTEGMARMTPASPRRAAPNPYTPGPTRGTGTGV